VTDTGRRLSYDALLVAVGAGSEPALRHALTWTPEADADLFAGLLRDLEEGYVKRLAFVVPAGVAWTLPAYELALMTAWQAWGMGQNDVDVVIYTPEDAPLGAFGAQASALVRQDLAEAGIRAETGTHIAEPPGAPGELIVYPGERPLDAERIVALRRAIGPNLPGVPSDVRGFIPADLHGRVIGLEAVWAAGDAITFPVKQGGLAAQEADAAAESIAFAAGADLQARPFHPVLRGVLLTGRGRTWMRHDPSNETPNAADRHALWWPPTKIAGRYLSPYLAERAGAGSGAQAPQPPGQPVDLDLQQSVPAAADALRRAELRGET